MQTRRSKNSVNLAATVAVACAGFLAACGSSSTSDAGASQSGDTPQVNACPVNGCTIEITEVSPEGEELRVTWSTDFVPDFSKNHIHLYWDTFTAEQVSGNAETVHSVTQGNWLPTDVMPGVVTEGAVSVATRGESTTLCVTAADFDHNVLDPSLVHCVDVSEHL